MKEQILKLRKEGKSYNEIQKELGCSKGTISYHCGEGQKEKTRNTTRKRRYNLREQVQKIKQESKCVNCGEDRYWVLDFHHTESNEKEGNISRMMTYNTKGDIFKEISKCIVLCANCHRDLHYKERINCEEEELVHSTVS